MSIQTSFVLYHISDLDSRTFFCLLFIGIRLFPARIWMLLIRQIEKIIDTGVVKFCQLDQYLSGDINITALIVAVDPLAAIQYFSHICLCEITILP